MNSLIKYFISTIAFKKINDSYSDNRKNKDYIANQDNIKNKKFI